MSRARDVVDLLDRPLDALRSRRAGTGGVVALIYHRVGRRTASPVDLATSAFLAQLDEVADRVIDLDEALRLISDGGDRQPAAAPPVVLTFDDGTDDWPDVVLPALAERRLPAVFYVSTDFVERGRPFPAEGRPVSWAGLGELAASGLATIASHTHTHRVLAGTSVTEAGDEIDRSIDLIEDRIGLPCRHFAYPKAIAPSAAAEVVVRRRFASAALAGNRINRLGATDTHRLGRHAVTTADDMAAFRRTVAGGRRLEGWLREVRDARHAAAATTPATTPATTST